MTRIGIWLHPVALALVALCAVPDSIFGSSAQTFTWRYKASLPMARYSSAVAVYNDTIYVISGDNRLSHYRYNPSTNWDARATLPENGTGPYSGAALVGTKIYAVRNLRGEQMGIYDTATGLWSAGASMQTSREGASVVAVDGKIYVIGGMDSNLNGFGTVEVFDPTTNSWTSKKSMPTPRGFSASAVVNNLIYVIGGRNRNVSQTDEINMVEVYNPSTDNWEPKRPMPTPRWAAAVCVLDSKIYVVGGLSNYLNIFGYSNIVEEYDPTTNSWQTLNTPISVPRANAVAGVVSNKVYVIGGRNENGPLSSIEEGTPNSVNEIPPPPKIEETPSIVLSATSLTFEDTQVGANSQKTLTASNTGNGNLSITSITVSGSDGSQFRVSPISATIAAGQSQEVIVTFVPTTTGVKAASLTINHNAQGSPSSIALSGSGKSAQPDQPKPEISLSTANLSFGNVQRGKNKQLAVKISNMGNTELSISRISVEGMDASQFTVSRTTLTVVESQCGAVTVTFAPTSVGQKSASLSIVHNAVGSPSTVSLRGTGIRASASSANRGFIKPVKDSDLPAGLSWGITPGQDFGEYNEDYKGHHPGEDWNATGREDECKPVYAIADGVVERVSEIANVLVLKHRGTFTIPGKSGTENGQRYSYPTARVNSIYSVYIHIRDITVKKPGDTVQQEKILGYIINPVGGPHLHFEIRHPGAKNSNNGSLVYPSDASKLRPEGNWSYTDGAPNGYYINLQEMIRAGLRDPSDFINANTNSRISSVSGMSSGLNLFFSTLSDFNSNNKVDFDDFFLFSDVFGQQAIGENSKFDLDGNNTIDFNDFFLFSDTFGGDHSSQNNK